MTSKLSLTVLALGAGILLAACDKPAPPPVGSAAAPAAPAAAPATPPTAAAPAPGVPLAEPATATKETKTAKAANPHALPAGVDLAPAPKATPLVAPVKAAGKQQVNFIGAIASVPTDWQSTPPANPMRVAQFMTPAAKNGDAAEMVVFFFTAGRGGSQEENIARWKSQFSAPNGGAVEPKLSQTKIGELPVTRVELAGNYSRGVGMSSEAQVKPNQILLAAIVTTPNQGNLTLHFYGSKDAVNQYRGAFDDILSSLRFSGH